jgi:UDP-2,3-diacylglucosamine hydrolase
VKTYSSPVIFLSDCHLPLIKRPENLNWTDRVVNFLHEVAPAANTIFLVGDIFDFWFEWRHSVPSRAFPLLAALNELVRDGKKIIFLGGNHDGHVGKFLVNEVGLEVSRESLDVNVDGKRFHIIHGDGVAPADKGYRLLRTLVRWGPTESLYKLLHPDIGIWLAYRLSGFSHHHLSSQDNFGAEPYRDYAKSKLDDGSDYVVIGHRHTAEHITYDNGEYLAIGEWIRKGSYGLFENGLAQLKYY